MTRRQLLIVLLGVAATLLSACNGSVSEKYQLVSNTDGNLTFLDAQGGKVYYVNKSGSIVDVVDLRISADDVESIKKGKEARDASQKNRDLGEQQLSGTRYTLSAQIRYYKDRLLYRIEMKPYDQTAEYKAGTIRIHLMDQMGFTLEKIDPANWYAEVDSKGTRFAMAAAGEVPMTLDNFLEVANWLPSWRF